MVSVASVICVICDKKVLSIFKTVALSENYNAKKLMTNLKLTRKQCYSRMEKLMQVGLIKRISGRYSLTSLGKVIFSTIVKIETAIKYYWKLKAIDTFMIMSTAYGKDLPVQECQRTMDSLIDNKEIKTILLSDMFDSINSAGSNKREVRQYYIKKPGKLYVSPYSEYERKNKE